MSLQMTWKIQLKTKFNYFDIQLDDSTDADVAYATVLLVYKF